MTHPFLSERLASAHLSDLHAEATRVRKFRDLARRRRFELLRRTARGARPQLTLVRSPDALAGNDGDAPVGNQVA